MSIGGFGGWMLRKVRMFFFKITNKRVEAYSLDIYHDISLKFNADVPIEYHQAC